MYEEGADRLVSDALDPFDQLVTPRMAGKALNAFDGGVHAHILAEQAHLLRPVKQHAAERSFRLIACKNDRRIRPVQIVFQMMADAPRVAHAGG